jgi:hypothetical protein
MKCVALHGQESVTVGLLLLFLLLGCINALLSELNAWWRLQKYRIYMIPT